MTKASSYRLFVLLAATFAACARADDSPPSSQSAQPPLPRVEVTGTHALEDNYRVDAVDSLGPMGTAKILDTPYTLGLLPLDLIQISQATNFKYVSKYLPLVAFQEQQ